MIVSSIEHAELVFKDWVTREIGWVAMDTETQSKARYPDRASTLIRGRMDIRIFSMCYMGESYSFPTSFMGTEYPAVPVWMELINAKLIGRISKLTSVFHNANYDLGPMYESGLRVSSIWDTMIGCWISNQNEEKGLKVRAPYLGRFIRDTRSVDFSDLIALAEYAEGDVVATDELYQMHMFGKIIRRAMFHRIDRRGLKVEEVVKGLPVGSITVPEEQLSPFHREFLRSQELPVLKTTLRAERAGVPVNLARLKEVSAKCVEDIERTKKLVFREAGRKFALGSNKEKTAVLLEKGVPLTKTTKKGALSVKYDFLVPLINYPIVKNLIDYNKAIKLFSTYLGPKGFKYYYNPQTKCIHPTLNTVGAVTGRHSASNPNLQTVPARNDRYGIKSVFEAPNGESFICLDFSQIELRVMALFSQEKRMLRTLNSEDGDIHLETATNLKVPRDPVAKQCNFLLIFGGGGYALRERLLVEGHYMELPEAEAIVDAFDQTYPRVTEFRQEMYAFHRANGYIPLLTGRRRVIENLDSTNRYLRHKAETQCANNAVQASAQDLLKCALVRVDPLLPNFDRSLPLRLKMTEQHRHFLKLYEKEVDDSRKFFKDPACKLKYRLQVHDEVLFTANTSRAVEAGKRIARIMSYRPYWQPMYEFNVAIRADGGVGPNWLAAKKPKDPSLKIESPLVIWN